VVELLDRPDNSDEEIRGNLLDLERLNRYFGGVRTVLLHMSRMIGARSQTRVTILDIATGGADIPRAICRWARSRKLAVTVEAVDRSEQVLAVARGRLTDYPEIRLRRAEVPPLPYSDRSFDFAISSQLLHHLTEAEGVRLLRDMGRVTRLGVIVTDLVRSRRAYISTAIATRLLRTSRLTRNDAPVSVLRAYRPDEALRMAAEAGLLDPTISFHPWFRFALVQEITRCA
jgi:ubiquinone/menaquinone biosynthesis C-methylase UbiE